MFFSKKGKFGLMSRNKIILMWCAGLIIALGIVGSIIAFVTREREIKIGFVSPTSGPVREVGLRFVYAAQVAVDEQNAQGGIDGKKIVLIPVDGQCSEEGGKSAAEYLVNVEEVNVIIGGDCSGETFGIASVAEPAGVAVLSYMSTNPGITQAGDYIFRNVPSDAINARTLAAYASKTGKRFLVISDDSVFARGFVTSFAAGVKDAGGEVVKEFTFPESTLDFDEYTAQIAPLQFDAVAMSSNGEIVTAQLIRALREKGITAPFYGADEMQDIDFPRVVGDNVGEVYSIMPPQLRVDDSRVQNFLKLYEQKNLTGKTEGGIGLGYDATKIILQAIDVVGDDAEKIKDYLYTMPAYTGIIGSYAFDENGDVTGFQNMIVKYNSELRKLAPLQQ